MKTRLRFIDESGDQISEKEWSGQNLAMPVPNPGELISLAGHSYEVKSRYFLYLENSPIDLQVEISCEILKS